MAVPAWCWNAIFAILIWFDLIYRVVLLKIGIIQRIENNKIRKDFMIFVTEYSKQMKRTQTAYVRRIASHLFIENDYWCVIQCQVSIYRELRLKKKKKKRQQRRKFNEWIKMWEKERTMHFNACFHH